MLLTSLPYEIINKIYVKLPLQQRIIFYNTTSFLRKELDNPYVCLYKIIKEHDKLNYIYICTSQVNTYLQNKINIFEIFYSFNKKNTKIIKMNEDHIIKIKKIEDHYWYEYITKIRCHINEDKKIDLINDYGYITPEVVTIYYNDIYVDNKNKYSEYVNDILETGIIYFYTSYQHPPIININKIMYTYGIYKNKENQTMFYSEIHELHICDDNKVQVFVKCYIYTSFIQYIKKITFDREQLINVSKNNHIDYDQYENMVDMIYCILD